MPEVTRMLHREEPGACHKRQPTLRQQFTLPLTTVYAALKDPQTPTVYAVYAISSLDTSSPLRHRTRQRRRGTPGSCRARSPALHVGGRDRVASCVHVHRTRMLICMHIWGSSLHLPPHRRSSIVIGARARVHSGSRAARGCCCQRRRGQIDSRARGRLRRHHGARAAVQSDTQPHG